MFISLWPCCVFVALRGLSLAVESWFCSCCRAWALGVQASVVVAPACSSCGSPALERWLSSCGAWAQLLWGMWDTPGSGIEPVSSALAGRFLAASSPGKTEVTLCEVHLHLWEKSPFVRVSPFEPRRGIITSQGRNTYQWGSQDLNLQTIFCLFTVLCMITCHKWPLPSPQGLSSVWGWRAIYGEVFGHFREDSVFLGISSLCKRYTCSLNFFLLIICV